MVGIESLKYQNLGDFLYPKIDEHEYRPRIMEPFWSHRLILDTLECKKGSPC